MPPLIESKREVLYVDGIYLGRKAMHINML